MPNGLSPEIKNISSAILICIASLGCEKIDIKQGQRADPQRQTSSSPTSGTSIYRYLSAIADEYPNRDDLVNLCIERHGFKLHLPKASIRSAHNIRLPVSKEWIENKQVVGKEYKTIIVQPPPVNGIILQPIERQVPYTVTKNEESRKNVSGTCIGTEYILE